MNVLRASAALAAAIAALVASSLAAQTVDFDGRPTGFLTSRRAACRRTRGRARRSATAKRLVSSLPAAPRSRALRDLQFTVLVSELDAAGSRWQPAARLFARKVEKLAAMGEGESLNEMVRSGGRLRRPGDRDHGRQCA